MELKLLPLMLAQNAVAKLIDVGVVVLSLALYAGGRMELLNCVMLSICSFLLTEGLEQAGTQSSLLRVVDTCINQASGVLNLPAMDISGAELAPSRRDLRAENIRFSYGEKPISNGITLDIPEADDDRDRRTVRRRQDHALPSAFPLLGCRRRARDARRTRCAGIQHGQPDAKFQLCFSKRLSVP